MARKPPLGKELEAARIIARAARELGQLADGPIPQKWKRLTARALAGTADSDHRPSRNTLVEYGPDPLAHLYKRRGAPKQPLQKRPIGRPGRDLRWDRGFLSLFDESKSRLLATGVPNPTDKRVIEEIARWEDENFERLTRDQRRHWIEYLRKTLPESRKRVRKLSAKSAK